MVCLSIRMTRRSYLVTVGPFLSKECIDRQQDLYEEHSVRPESILPRGFISGLREILYHGFDKLIKLIQVNVGKYDATLRSSIFSLKNRNLAIKAITHLVAALEKLCDQSNEFLVSDTFSHNAKQLAVFDIVKAALDVSLITQS